MVDLYSDSVVPNYWCNFLYDWPQYAVQELQSFPVNLTDRAKRLNVVPQQALALAKQSGNTRDSFIQIPETLRNHYTRYRPTPLRRAKSFECALNTSAQIYYKFEGANISGSHKLNTALAQAYYYKNAGASHLVTGTGAGQWGTALAYACKLFDLDCTVFMVGASLRQKPQRRAIMELFGAKVYESPSDTTAVGRASAKKDPKRIGALGVATGEALELSTERKRTRFAVGSGENCVLLHQTIIGVEAIAQMDLMGAFPDFVIACIGAGSNFAGISMPFLRGARERGRNLHVLAVEPTACPKLTRGKFAYDVSDFSGTTPIAKMYTLGSGYTPPPIYAGGLRYHGTSPFLSAMYATSHFEALAVNQLLALRAGILFSETEGILPAPESAHAIAGAMHVCQQRAASANPIVILINISGHGMFDLAAYQHFLEGSIDAGEPDEESLRNSIGELERLNGMVEV